MPKYLLLLGLIKHVATTPASQNLATMLLYVKPRGSIKAANRTTQQMAAKDADPQLHAMKVRQSFCKR